MVVGVHDGLNEKEDEASNGDKGRLMAQSYEVTREWHGRRCALQRDELEVQNWT